jgi:hypothetical protein
LKVVFAKKIYFDFQKRQTDFEQVSILIFYKTDLSVRFLSCPINITDSSKFQVGSESRFSKNCAVIKKEKSAKNNKSEMAGEVKTKKEQSAAIKGYLLLYNFGQVAG